MPTSLLHSRGSRGDTMMTRCRRHLHHLRRLAYSAGVEKTQELKDTSTLYIYIGCACMHITVIQRYFISESSRGIGINVLIRPAQLCPELFFIPTRILSIILPATSFVIFFWSGFGRMVRSRMDPSASFVSTDVQNLQLSLLSWPI